MLRFKDMYTVEYRPGEDEHINYRASRRHHIGEETVDEKRTMQTRLKLSRAARRNKAKLKMGRAKAARKFADMDTLKKRAKRSAYKALYKKLTKGASDITPGRKAEIEKKLAKPTFQSKISKVARKLIKTVRQREKDRKAAK
mgnify:FL=1